MKGDDTYLAFNRGVISPLALARLDLKRLALSAEEQTNFMPRATGPMSLRPGLKFLGIIGGEAEEPVEPPPPSKGLLGLFYGMDNDTSREAAQEAFLANLPAYTLYGFEDIALPNEGTVDDPITWWGTFTSPYLLTNGVTITQTEVPLVYSIAHAGVNFPPGRFPTEGNQFADITSFRMNLDPPVAAIGFYLTDVGDFETQIRFIVGCEDGRTFPLEPCAGSSGFNAAVEGNSVFFGVIKTDSPITSVAIHNESSFDYGQLDGFGIDSIIVALTDDVTAEGNVGFPTPWTFQFEGWLAVRFDALAAANQFNTEFVAPYPTTVAFTDSVGDSASAGTFIAAGGVAGGGAYKNVGGARATATFGDFDDVTPFINDVWFAEGRVARNGTINGTGQIMAIDNWLTVVINSDNKLEITVPYSGQYYDGFSTGYAESSLSFTSSAALTLGDLTHWRLNFARIKYESFGTPVGDRFLFSFYIDGVPQAALTGVDVFDSLDDPGWASFEIGHRGGGGSIPQVFGDVVVGGADGSNYTLCTQCDINILRTLGNEWRGGESIVIPDLPRQFIPPPT